MKIKAVGDIMLGDHPVCIGHGVDSTIRKHGFEFLFDGVRDALKGGDILFANLEAPLSDVGRRPDALSSIELRGRPDYARRLAMIGFNFINIANNHAMQHGIDAFRDTADNLDLAGIRVVGLANGDFCKEVYWSDGQTSIIFLGYSLRPEKFFHGKTPYALGSEGLVAEHVRKLRRAVNHPIVVSLHWGDEYLNYPSPAQVRFARGLIDAGANLILGHHPHVLQGVEQYGSGLIAYSLGNFIFDKWQRNPRETIVLSVEIGVNGIESWSVTPVKINKKFQPQIATGSTSAAIESKLFAYSAALGNERDPMHRRSSHQYAKIAAKAYLVFRLHSYAYFIRNIQRYELSFIVASLKRFLARRVSKEK